MINYLSRGASLDKYPFRLLLKRSGEHIPNRESTFLDYPLIRGVSPNFPINFPLSIVTNFLEERIDDLATFKFFVVKRNNLLANTGNNLLANTEFLAFHCSRYEEGAVLLQPES